MSEEPVLRTTIIQAFARTVVADSQRASDSSSGSRSGPGSGSGSGSGSSDGSSDRQDGAPGRRELAALPDVGDIVGTHYRLISLLGKGMFGKVYVAERVDVPEHRVALKLVPRSVYQGRNVERELVMLATVGHPNVVQMKDHGWTDDYVWLTMPVYQGETLAERLENGPLTLHEAHDIFLAIARGLDALHDCGLRHQDVKPDNIFLARFGKRVHPILLDLGVAAEKEAPFVAGTALFASPEQIAALNGYPGAIPLSEKMDTYCLATTLLVSLVGQKKFPGEEAKTREDIAIAQDRRADTPIPGDCLVDIDIEPRDKIQAAFKKWLALEPEERPTMSELADQLEVLLEPEREEERKEKRKRDKQRQAYARLRGFAGLLVIGAIGTMGVLFWKRQTIQMANQLEEAQSEKATSFDKLETCNASHRITKSNLDTCRIERAKDQTEFQNALTDVRQSGNSNEAERAKEMQGLGTRLKACDDEKASQQKSCADATAQLQSTSAKEKADLAAKLDEETTLAATRGDQLAAADAQKQACDSERQACLSERDQLRAKTGPPLQPRPIPSDLGNTNAGVLVPTFPAATNTPDVAPPPPKNDAPPPPQPANNPAP